MDRDARWDRTKQAYDAIVYGEGTKFNEPIKSIEESYAEGVNDEFVIPRVSRDYSGIKDGDVVIFYNFRPDRTRQLTKALSLNAKQFGNLFDRREDERPKKITLITMTVYDTMLKNVYAILGREHVSRTLSNILERNSIRQLRIAETEKYAHVTYFFNGLVEKQRKFEDRMLVPSLKEVGTYDKAPEMSARAIVKNAVATINEGQYGFTLINFANADMVGHSGSVEATIEAVETVDDCLGEILAAWREKRRTLSLVVTADHGNAEKMFDEGTGQPHTAHTSNPVPFCVVSEKWEAAEPSDGESGGLSDVAPTVLKIMGLEKPRAMTGTPLIRERRQAPE
jgi:2,3-bisphosphoglycerate-independent phosphoglycerate mutase